MSDATSARSGLPAHLQPRLVHLLSAATPEGRVLAVRRLIKSKQVQEQLRDTNYQQRINQSLSNRHSYSNWMGETEDPTILFQWGIPRLGYILSSSDYSETIKCWCRALTEEWRAVAAANGEMLPIAESRYVDGRESWNSRWKNGGGSDEHLSNST